MIFRQILGFGLVGGLQLVLDWACFVLLTAAGAPVVPANLLARAAGATAGYWLNGQYTFAQGGNSRLGSRPMVRYLIFWAAMALASSWAVQWLDHQQGLRAAWLGKPLVDAVLAGIGFLAAKYWIFR